MSDLKTRYALFSVCMQHLRPGLETPLPVQDLLELQIALPKQQRMLDLATACARILSAKECLQVAETYHSRFGACESVHRLLVYAYANAQQPGRALAQLRLGLSHAACRDVARHTTLSFAQATELLDIWNRCDRETTSETKEAFFAPLVRAFPFHIPFWEQAAAQVWRWKKELWDVVSSRCQPCTQLDKLTQPEIDWVGLEDRMWSRFSCSASQLEWMQNTVHALSLGSNTLVVDAANLYLNGKHAHPAWVRAVCERCKERNLTPLFVAHAHRIQHLPSSLARFAIPSGLHCNDDWVWQTIALHFRLPFLTNDEGGDHVHKDAEWKLWYAMHRVARFESEGRMRFRFPPQPWPRAQIHDSCLYLPSGDQWYQVDI